MPPEDLNRTVQRQRFDRVTSAGRGGGPEKRVVNRFFRSFDHGEEEWRHSIVCKCFLTARPISFALTERLEPHVGGGREGHSVVAAAVATGGARTCQAHHRPRCEAVEIACVDWRISCYHDDYRTIGSRRRCGEFVL